MIPLNVKRAELHRQGDFGSRNGLRWSDNGSDGRFLLAWRCPNWIKPRVKSSDNSTDGMSRKVNHLLLFGMDLELCWVWHSP